MKEKTYKVNEIFLSIQGEGPRVGRLAVFVRFSGCNLSCSFCDTRHSTWEDMTAKQIRSKVVELFHDTDTVIDLVFTGGEPLEQIDYELCEILSKDFNLCLETNGSVGLTSSTEDLKRIQRVLESSIKELVVSPKEDCDFSDLILRNATCLKILFPLPFGKQMLEDLVAVAGYNRFGDIEYVLQPMTVSSGIKSWEWKSECAEAYEFMKNRQKHYGEHWRIIPQTHVMMGLR